MEILEEDPKLTMEEEYIKDFIKNVFLRWSQFTFHGFHNIASAKYKLTRILWIIFFCTSLGLFLTTAVENIVVYYKFGTVVSSKTNFESPMIFPSVLICSLNTFSRDSTVFENILSKFNKTESIYDQNDPELRYFIRTYIGVEFSLDQIQNLSLSMDEMLISCYFNGEPCFSSDFQFTYIFEYGSCYTFNPGYNSTPPTNELRKVNKVGRPNGLRIELFLGDTAKDVGLTSSNGVHISIQDKSNVDYDAIGFDLPSGTHSFVQLQKTVNQKLQTSLSDCYSDFASVQTNDKTFISEVIYISSYYTQSLCFDFCYQSYFSKNCSCYDGVLHQILNYTTCTLNDFKCVFAFNNYFIASEQNLCSQFCPPECVQTLYDHSISSSQYPSRYYYNYLKQFLSKRFPEITNLDYESVRDSTISLNFYFENFYYNQNEEVLQVSVLNLLSQIGGSMGMFIGASILSYLEVVEVIVESLYILGGYYIDRHFLKKQRISPIKKYKNFHE